MEAAEEKKRMISVVHRINLTQQMSESDTSPIGHNKKRTHGS